MDQEFYEYCKREVYVVNDITTKNKHWFLIPAVSIVLLLSFLEKRKSIKPKLFGGRLSPARPLSFLDEPRNKWGILCVFGSITSTIIAVVQKTFGGDFPVWAKVFLIYILCLEACVLTYPLFACMTSRHRLVGAILGLLYSIGWFIFEIFVTVQYSRCNGKFNNEKRIGSSSRKLYRFESSFITANKIYLPRQFRQLSAGLVTAELRDVVNVNAHANIQELPIMLCDFGLMVKFTFKLYKCIKKKKFKVSYEEECQLCTEQHKIYVKHLISKPALKPDEQLSWREKIRIKVYGQVPGFTYPISVLSAVFMASVMLYMVGLYCAEFMEIQTKTTPVLENFEDLLTAANVIATLATFFCGIRNICIFLKNYRSHMIRLYKGDKSFIPETLKERGPNVYMAQGMRFLGTAIVGTFWGTVFCYLVVFVPLALMFMTFKILKMNGKLNQLTSQFEWAIYPACMILIFQIQTWLIGRFLIQPKIRKSDKKRPLAVDNRRVYDLLAFFCIFLNASIGLFTFLKRILVGAFMGLFMIPRMDRSLLMQGYEAMDKCYVNYIGMIMIDLSHNHPVMRVFCHVIHECAQVTWYAQAMQNTAENPVYGNIAVVRIPESKTDNTRAKRRWLLAYTLIKNPCLINDRRHEGIDTVDLKDVEFSESEDINEQEASCMRARWNNIKRCKCPRNLAINIIIMMVLLSFAILYAGIPLLMKDVIAGAESVSGGL